MQSWTKLSYNKQYKVARLDDVGKAFNAGGVERGNSGDPIDDCR